MSILLSLSGSVMQNAWGRRILNIMKYHQVQYGSNSAFNYLYYAIYTNTREKNDLMTSMFVYL